MGKTIIVSPTKFKKAKKRFPSIVGRRIKEGYIVDSVSIKYAFRKKK